MNRKDLYRAIGNIDDKYLLTRKRKTVFSRSEIIRVLHDTEIQTISMSVVRKKKILPKLIAAILILTVGAAAVTAACFGLWKDKNKDGETRKIPAYFHEDGAFDLNASEPELLASDGENIYFRGWNSGADPYTYAAFYDFDTGEEISIDLEDYVYMKLQTVAVTDDHLWLTAYEGNSVTESGELLRADRKTGKIDGKISLNEYEKTCFVNKREGGGWLVGKVSISVKEHDIDGQMYPVSEITGVFLDVFDKDLRLVSEKKVSDSNKTETGGCRIAGLAPGTDGSFCIVYSKEDVAGWTLCSYSADGKELFSQNITIEENYGLRDMSLNKDGDPVIIYDPLSESDNMILEKIDRNTGEVSAKFAFDPDDDPENYMFISFANSGLQDYDVTYFSYPYVYGLNAADEEKTVLADLSECNGITPHTNDVKFSEEGMLFSEIKTGDNDENIGKSCLMKADMKGRKIKTVRIENELGLGETAFVKQIRAVGNDELQVLCSGIREENPDESYEDFYLLIMDSDLNVKEKYCLGPHVYSREFITDDDGRILLYDHLKHRLVFSDAAYNGNEELTAADELTEAFFFKSGPDCYCAVPVSSGGRTVIFKVDFDNKRITELNTLDFVIKDAEDGDGSYDAYFILDDSVKGYKFSDNSCDEIVNWPGIGITLDIRDTAVISKDTLLVGYSDSERKTKLYRRIG